MRSYVFISGVLTATMFTGQVGAVPTVKFSGDKNEPILTLDADKNKLTAYILGSSLNIIFDKNSPEVNLPKEMRETLGLKSQQSLKVEGGYGVKFVFESWPEDLDVRFDNLRQSPAPLGEMHLKDRIVFSGTSSQDIVKVNDLYEGKVFYALLGDDLSPKNSFQEYRGIQFLPTITGRLWSYPQNESSVESKVEDGSLIVQNSVSLQFEKAEKLEEVLQPVIEEKSEKNTEQVLSATPLQVKRVLKPASSPDEVKSQMNRATFDEAVNVLGKVMDRLEGFKVPERSKERVDYIRNFQEPEAIPNAISLREQRRLEEERLRKENEAYEEESFIEVSEPVALDEGDILFPESGEERNYVKAYQYVLSKLSKSESVKDKNDNRLRLARLFLEFDRPHDALSVLDAMDKFASTGFPKSPMARVLKGVSNALVGRYEEAINLLKPSGGPNDDRELWLAYALAESGKYEEAKKLFEKTIDFSRGYAYPLQKRLRISYGQVLLADEKIADLEKSLKILTYFTEDGDYPDEAKLLLGKAKAKIRRDKEAEDLLTRASASSNLEVAYPAQYEFVSLLLKRGDIEQEQAIEHFERLRYIWRGGGVEADILYKLGQMYLLNGEHRKGLERLKYLTTYFPDYEKNDIVTDMMRDLFVKLIKGKENTVLDSLEITGLYYDFRELTPPGDEGDRMILDVVNRLKQLNLFERAEEILERQLKYRVKDTGKKPVIEADLADIYMMDSRFEKGLEVLGRTDYDSLDPEVEDRRKLLKASLLIELSRYDDALAVIGDHNGEKFIHLKAKIAWNQQNYGELIRLVEPNFNLRSTSKPFSEEEEHQMMWLAIAYNEKGDFYPLQELRNKFSSSIQTEGLEYTLEFLLRDAGSNEVSVYQQPDNSWEETINNFGVYHDFVSDYNEMKELREQERIQREIFNRRQRQTTAPRRYGIEKYEE